MRFPTVIPLSSLNGQNGFKIDGETINDLSGISVSAVGDVNDDGIADLIIGAYGYNNNVGRSYVVFGGANIGSSGLISLSTLNGANGFKLDGEESGDYSGDSVSGGFDINGDGISDLIIGASHYNSGIGRSYVLFGSLSIGGNGIFNLNTLNGTNGFKLDGETAGDFSGYPVSSAGDFNHDGIDDVIIGAHGHNSLAGRSYVVFGNSNVGSSGLISLGALNGTNGFKMDGEIAGDRSGYSVSGAADINGDKIVDLIIGAPVYNGYTGRSYIVFGGHSVGSSGELALSSLNGVNGFKLDGEALTDASGWIVNIGGDINGDGIADMIIGAPNRNSGTGRSYVVFGSSSIGSSGRLFLSSLNGPNGFKIDGETSSDASGFSSVAGDFNGDGIADMIIGAPDGNNNIGRSYVIFGNSSVGNNGLISLNALNGINGFKVDGEVENDASGNFVSNAGDINGDGIIDLMIASPNHNNGIGRNYILFGGNLSSLPLTNSPSQAPSVKPSLLPTLEPSSRPSLLPTGEPTLQPSLKPSSKPSLLPTRLPSRAPTQLPSQKPSMIPSKEPSLEPSASPTQLPSLEPSLFPTQVPSLMPTQAPSREPSTKPSKEPSLEPSALPTRLPSAQPSIHPSREPSLQPTQMPSLSPTPALDVLTNSFSVIQGKRVLLSSDNFATTQDQIAYIDSNTLLFTISNVVAGYFSLVQSPLMPMNQFTQHQVNTRQVQFTQDGTANVPSYQVSLSAGLEQSQLRFSNIIFYAEPTLVNNQIIVIPGQHMVLTTANLLAINNNIPNTELIFRIGHVQNGYFTPTQLPTQLTTQFSQADISGALIKFVSNSTDMPPAYDVRVTNSVNLTVGPRTAQVTFNLPVTSSPTTLLNTNLENAATASSTTSTTIRNAIIGGTVSGVLGLGFFGLKIYLNHRAEEAYKRARQGVSKEQAMYKENVIQPIAEEVARNIEIKTLGYIGDDSMRDYIRAIESLVHELDIRGVKVNLPEMKPIQRTRLLNEIVRKIKKILLPPESDSCCSCISCASISELFCPQIKASDLEENREVLADAIAATMKINNPIQSPVTVSRHHEGSPASHVVSEAFLFSEQKSALSCDTESDELSVPQAMTSQSIDRPDNVPLGSPIVSAALNSANSKGATTSIINPVDALETQGSITVNIVSIAQKKVTASLPEDASMLAPNMISIFDHQDRIEAILTISKAEEEEQQENSTSISQKNSNIDVNTISSSTKANPSMLVYSSQVVKLPAIASNKPSIEAGSLPSEANIRAISKSLSVPRTAKMGIVVPTLLSPVSVSSPTNAQNQKLSRFLQLPRVTDISMFTRYADSPAIIRGDSSKTASSTVTASYEGVAIQNRGG